jgi:hypothetical protein
MTYQPSVCEIPVDDISESDMEDLLNEQAIDVDLKQKWCDQTPEKRKPEAQDGPPTKLEFSERGR